MYQFNRNEEKEQEYPAEAIKKDETEENNKTAQDSKSDAANLAANKLSDLTPKQKIKPIPKARSLFLFSHENKFRRACHFISNHRWFSNSLLVCILVSSIMLAAEDPVNYKSKTNEVYFFLIE